MGIVEAVCVVGLGAVIGGALVKSRSGASARRPASSTADELGPQSAGANWLIGLDGPVAERAFFLGTRVATIGRSANNLIQVTLPEVSRVHCQVRPSAQGLHLIDMRSRFGVFVNGERVSAALLRDGDRLTLGGVRFLFHQGPGCTADATRDRKRRELEVDFDTCVAARRDTAPNATVAEAG